LRLLDDTGTEIYARDFPFSLFPQEADWVALSLDRLPSLRDVASVTCMLDARTGTDQAIILYFDKKATAGHSGEVKGTLLDAPFKAREWMIRLTLPVIMCFRGRGCRIRVGCLPSLRDGGIRIDYYRGWRFAYPRLP